MPPKPAFFSAFSSSTSTDSPAAFAAADASSAKTAGGRSEGGAFTRSRVRCTACATVWARSRPFFAERSRAAAVTTTTESTGSLWSAIEATR